MKRKTPEHEKPCKRPRIPCFVVTDLPFDILERIALLTNQVGYRTLACTTKEWKAVIEASPYIVLKKWICYFNHEKKLSVDMMKWIMHIGRSLMETWPVRVAKCGTVEHLEYLLSLSLTMDEFTLMKAAIRGDMEIIQWIFDNLKQLPPDCKTVLQGAARNGDVDNLRWFSGLGFPLTKECFVEAARYGNRKAMEWLHENDCPWNYHTFHSATLYGDLDNMKWLYKIGYKPYHCASEIAVHCDKVENLLWMKEKGLSMRAAMNAAARKGCFKIIKHLHASGIALDSNVTECAFKHGNLEIIQWMMDHGCIFSTRNAIALAAHNGHLNIVKHFRANGCEWDEMALPLAIDRGHMEIMQWLLDQDCPYEYFMCTTACHTNRTEKWVEENLVGADAIEVDSRLKKLEAKNLTNGINDEDCRRFQEWMDKCIRMCHSS